MNVKEHIFRPIFGSDPQRLLEALILHPDFDYRLSELAEITGISEPDLLLLHVPAFEHYGIIKRIHKEGVPSRQEGISSRRYSFDRDSPIGQLLNSLALKLADLDLPLYL